MLKWFRPGPPPHQTALAMIGAKAGDRVLVVGRADAGLAGELARTTGLNGQTLVGCRADARSAVEAAAANAGALVDVVEIAATDRSPVPHGMTEIDVLVALLDLGVDDTRRPARGGHRRGARATSRRPARRHRREKRRRPVRPAQDARDASDVVVPLLTSVGAQAARALGVVDGVTYYEARKSR